MSKAVRTGTSVRCPVRLPATANRHLRAKPISYFHDELGRRISILCAQIPCALAPIAAHRGPDIPCQGDRQESRQRDQEYSKGCHRRWHIAHLCRPQRQYPRRRRTPTRLTKRDTQPGPEPMSRSLIWGLIWGLSRGGSRSWGTRHGRGRARLGYRFRARRGWRRRLARPSDGAWNSCRRRGRRTALEGEKRRPDHHAEGKGSDTGCKQSHHDDRRLADWVEILCMPRWSGTAVPCGTEPSDRKDAPRWEREERRGKQLRGWRCQDECARAHPQPAPTPALATSSAALPGEQRGTRQPNAWAGCHVGSRGTRVMVLSLSLACRTTMARRTRPSLGPPSPAATRARWELTSAGDRLARSLDLRCRSTPRRAMAHASVRYGLPIEGDNHGKIAGGRRCCGRVGAAIGLKQTVVGYDKPA